MAHNLLDRYAAYACSNFMVATLTDDRLSSSSIFQNKEAYHHRHARLSSSNGWSPEVADPNSWIQADFGHVVRITAVVTKGLGITHLNEWVKEYQVKYSNISLKWTSVTKNPGDMFTANTDHSTEVVNVFPSAVEARYLRLYPTACNNFCSLRFDVLGCEVRPSTSTTTTSTTATHSPTIATDPTSSTSTTNPTTTFTNIHTPSTSTTHATMTTDQPITLTTTEYAHTTVTDPTISTTTTHAPMTTDPTTTSTTTTTHAPMTSDTTTTSTTTTTHAPMTTDLTTSTITTTHVPTTTDLTISTTTTHEPATTHTPTTPISTTNSRLTTVTTVKESCLCVCVKKYNYTMTQAELDVRLSDIVQNLTVPKKTTSSFIRSKISVQDNRPEVLYVGSVGIVLLIIVASLIVLPDLFTFSRFLFLLFKKKKECET